MTLLVHCDRVQALCTLRVSSLRTYEEYGDCQCRQAEAT